MLAIGFGSTNVGGSLNKNSLQEQFLGNNESGSQLEGHPKVNRK